MLTPKPVRRNEEGDWTHPALSEFAGDREYIPSDEWKAWQAKHNIETVIHQMEYDLDEDHPAWIRHFDEGHPGSVGWNPEPPGEEWYLLSIHDTEDGPVVIWYREIKEQLMKKEHPNQKDCTNCGEPMAWKNLEENRCLNCNPYPEDSPSAALMNPAVSAEILSENRKLRQRITELEKVATDVRRDLMLRSEPDWDGSGPKIVNLSASIWDELNRVLEIQGNRREGK